MQELSRDFDIVNATKPSTNGALDIYRHIFKTDVVLLNWIENIPDRRGGIVQAFFVYVLLIARKVLGVRIAWVLHNKLSHTKSNAGLKSLLMRALVRHSDVIVTHAREGVDYACRIDRRAEGKIHFLHHPVDSFTVPEARDRALDIDVLIWGSMHAYKGVREFLERLGSRKAATPIRTLVWGHFPDETYYQDCLEISPPGVEIRNSIVSDEELRALHERVRVVLFPYSPGSVLSSGALMRSLDSAASIVGPDVGAFRDLAEAGLVRTYRDPSEMIEVVEKALAEGGGPELLSARRAFFERTSWARQTGEIARVIRGA